jgi:hypothetical protein
MLGNKRKKRKMKREMGGHEEKRRHIRCAASKTTRKGDRS